jgi:hypothetical protein
MLAFPKGHNVGITGLCLTNPRRHDIQSNGSQRCDTPQRRSAQRSNGKSIGFKNLMLSAAV